MLTSIKVLSKTVSFGVFPALRQHTGFLKLNNCDFGCVCCLLLRKAWQLTHPTKQTLIDETVANVLSQPLPLRLEAGPVYKHTETHAHMGSTVCCGNNKSWRAYTKVCPASLRCFALSFETGSSFDCHHLLIYFHTWSSSDWLFVRMMAQ